ncbi:hypothetical protein [Novosphingobium sp. 9]|uniref:hypothetical protein n=1 Tax=Novosphingobium sp. 9 TaxID=2025349 RepID=UPI0021B5579A|nr:hypothetical protein [Novosphingobium sp. 9]
MTALLMLAAAVASQTIPVTPKLLEGLPDVQAVLNDHGTRRMCEGPALADVLARAGVPHGKDLHGSELTKGVIVHARDGYAVLFSLGEIDPGLGHEGMIIAERCDGQALDDKTGPYRLIVPGDLRPARSVRQVKALEIR